MTHALVYMPAADGWRERIVAVELLGEPRRIGCGRCANGSLQEVEMVLQRVRLTGSGEVLRVAAERLGTPEELAPVLAQMQPARRTEADPVPFRERSKMTEAEKQRKYRHRQALLADPARLEAHLERDRERKRKAAERKRREAELRAAATLPKKRFNTPFGRGLRG